MKRIAIAITALTLILSACTTADGKSVGDVPKDAPTETVIEAPTAEPTVAPVGWQGPTELFAVWTCPADAPIPGDIEEWAVNGQTSTELRHPTEDRLLDARYLIANDCEIND